MTQAQSISALIYIVPIVSSFIGAISGALGAYFLGGLREKLYKRERQLGAINSAVYGLDATLDSLLSLKKQYLIEQASLFGEMIRILGELPFPTDESTTRKIARDAYEIYQKISSNDRLLNGAFIKWQVVDFPMMPSPKDLAFTVFNAPDLVRVVHSAGIEVAQVTQGIIDRNEIWKKKEAVLLQEKPIGEQHLLFWFEMLSLRTAILYHTDWALLAIPKALELLNTYREVHLKKRNWVKRLMFGEEGWTPYKIKDDLKQYMPDKTAILGELVLAGEK